MYRRALLVACIAVAVPATAGAMPAYDHAPRDDASCVSRGAHAPLHASPRGDRRE